MPLSWFLSALLDVAAPESCVLCGARPGERAWCPRGGRARGLRAIDQPHLCLDCLESARGDGPITGVTPGGVPIAAARATGPELVALVGAWKYHGQRGLAWPLAALLEPAYRALQESLGARPVLVPVPLHRRRRRGRGFNQAALLAHLLAGRAGGEAADLLERVRATGQQARLDDDDARRLNLRQCFRVRRRMEVPQRPLVLVDDIVTSGATLDEAARALAGAGHPVAAALGLGLRAGPG